MPGGKKRKEPEGDDVTDEELMETGVSSVKKRKKHPALDESQLQEICQDLYDVIRNQKTSDGRVLCEPFIRAPTKRAEPEYYTKVRIAMDMTKIQNKIKSEEYHDISEMTDDVKLMVNNAKAIHQSTSSEYQQAVELWQLFSMQRSRLIGEALGQDVEQYAGDDPDEKDTTLEERVESRRGGIVYDDVTDEETRSSLIEAGEGNTVAEPAVESAASELRVPVLKLKVLSTTSVTVSEQSSADTLVEGSSTGEASKLEDKAAQQLDTSSEDVEAAQSFLSSGSEVEDMQIEETTLTTPISAKTRRGRSSSRITGGLTRRQQAATAAGGSGDDSSAADRMIQYEQLFTAVLNATSGNRNLSDVFKVLPSRKKYAEYYKVIKNPIDLRTIARKIQACEYSTLDEMYSDLQLMVQNARTFNESGSVIYKDAGLLKKIITSKKAELDKCKTPGKSVLGQRIHTSQSEGDTLPLSASIAELRSTDSEDSDDDEDDDEDEVEPVENTRTNSNASRRSTAKGRRKTESVDSSPASATASTATKDATASETGEYGDMWTLFNAVRHYKTSTGQTISDPFVKLPSRRMYPDYYQEIDQPISLTKIQTFLRNGVYQEIEDVAEDLNLLFNNARQYNVEESKIYKDAAKLQQVMNQKKIELQRKAAMNTASEPKVTAKVVEETPGGGTKRKRRQSVVSTSSSVGITSGTISADIMSDPLKCRLLYLYKTALEHQYMGRRLSTIFQTLPCRKDYPDYYKVISEPIDLSIIEQRIKNDKYSSQQALMSDFELMFMNARHYNEERSQVYKDADMLERLLTSRVRALPPVDDQPLLCKATTANSGGKTKLAEGTPLPIKLRDLYNTIRDHADSKGRALSAPFMKLPSRADYPEYYDIIKKPIDMQKIYQRLMSNQYSCVEDMVSDVVLMCDNACKFNEPDSLIYKDALTLQRVCMEKKSELCDDNDTPDVQAAVQSIMTNLFLSTFNHVDEEGRCYADSFLELPHKMIPKEAQEGDAEEVGGVKTKLKPAPTFEQVQKNLGKGLYRRVDRFQDDMFEVFSYAREVSPIDSQIYEDSVELQMYFIDQRDILCKKGETLLTPALSYTQQHLTKELDQLRKQGSASGQHGGEEDESKVRDVSNAAPVTGDSKDEMQNATEEEKSKSTADEIDYKGTAYHIGDFVYIEPREKGLDPHIVCIERHFTDDNGEQNLYGCWFLRPSETYHVQSRKFLQKEVFKSDFYDSVPFSKVLGKCCVMFVKEYFKFKPENIPDDDVYVCESRYTSKIKTSKKIKIWQMPKNEHIEFIERPKPLQPVRVSSVFADKSTAAALGSGDQLDDSCASGEEVLDKVRETVALENVPAGAESGCLYYEQYQGPSGWLKLGDHVYLKSSSTEKPVIACIEKLWTNSSGDAFFYGPYFCWPADVEHSPTRLFYRKEVLRTTRADSIPLISVAGRCSVLSYKEFTTCRLTEISPEDVYICESKYMHEERLIKKYTKLLKRTNLSVDVCDDEVYFFKKPIVPTKEPSPLLSKVTEETPADDDSNDVGRESTDEEIEDDDDITASIADNEDSLNISLALSSQPSCSQTTLASTSSVSPKKGKKGPKAMKDQEPRTKRTISGYILYAAECRKSIIAEYPKYNFGEISREVGVRWKAQSRDVKDKYEEQARVLAQEAKQMADLKAEEQLLTKSDESRSSTPMFSTSFGGQFAMPGQQIIRTCGQQNTAWTTHPSSSMHLSQPGSIPAYYTTSVLQDYSQAQGSAVGQGNGYMLPPGQGQMTEQQNLPYPVYQLQQQQLNQLSQQQHDQLQQQQLQMSAAAQASLPVPSSKPPAPMFVSVPPRTQRLVHSEAYLRYIESLSAGSRTISDWDKGFSKSKREAIQLPDPKLPCHWLGNGPGRHDNAVSALWALHDLMLKDALSLSN